MALTVFFRILAVLLMLGAGWFARRRGIFPASALKPLSAYVVLMAQPALLVLRTVETIDRASLAREWIYPLLGAGIVAVGHGLGALLAPAAMGRGRRAAFLACVMVPNWLYMALPVVEPLYGAEGTRILLLLNIGFTVYFWSGVVAVFARERGLPNPGHATLAEALPADAGPPPRPVWRELLNPSLAATFAGLAILLVWPGAAAVAAGDAGKSLPPALALPAGALVDMLTWLAVTALPVNFLVTGAQMADAWGGAPRTERPRAVPFAAAARLVFAPGAVLALLGLAVLAGWRPGEAGFMAAALVAAMPSAVGVSLLAEVYDGDTALAAKTILATTLLSLATLPPFAFLARTAYGWATGL